MPNHYFISSLLILYLSKEEGVSPLALSETEPLATLDYPMAAAYFLTD